MFGVLGRKRREKLLANLLAYFESHERNTLKDAWAQVGLNLYHAIKLYEDSERESRLE